MNPLRPPLNPLRVFESVARNHTFAAAAQELHISQGAVSHQIKTLEDWLGFKLFERQAGRSLLTGGAQAYAGALHGAFAEIVRATQELVSVGAQRVLNVRGHTTFFTHWLIPLLPKFQELHPDIKVRLAANVERVDFQDFQRENVDVGIRYGDGDWDGLRSDLIIRDALTPIMAPKLAARLPQPCSAEDILRLPLLHSTRISAHWPDWIKAANAKRSTVAGDMYYEDLSIIYECAVQGLGVAMGQLRHFQNELAQGKLVAPHPFVLRRPRGYYLVCPEGKAADSKIASFRDWMLTQI
jgi:LysR family glycine cleavage system transcriptional activator